MPNDKLFEYEQLLKGIVPPQQESLSGQPVLTPEELAGLAPPTEPTYDGLDPLAGFDVDAGLAPAPEQQPIPYAPGLGPEVSREPASVDLPISKEEPKKQSKSESKPSPKKEEGMSQDSRARLLDVFTKLGQGVAQFGATRATAEAGAAGNTRLDAPNLNLKDPEIYKSYVGRKAAERKASLAEKREDSIAKQRQTQENIQRENLELRRKQIDSQSESRLERNNLRLDERQRKAGQFARSEAKKWVDAAEGSPSYKSSRKMIDTIDRMGAILEDARFQGGQSLSMLGPQMAKGIAGEVGVLTEQDVKRYVQNPSFVGGVKDTIAKFKSGKITKESYGNIHRLMNIMEKKAAHEKSMVYDRKASQFSRIAKLSYPEARHLIDPDYTDLPPDKYENKHRVTVKNPKTNKNVDMIWNGVKYVKDYK